MMPLKDKRKTQKVKIATAKRRVEEHSSGFESTSLTMPKGATFFAPKKAGVYRLSIVPYTVSKRAGKFTQNFAEPGELYAERTFWLHRVPQPGGGNKSDGYICAKKTFKGGKCAVCDYLDRLGRDPDRDKETDELIKRMKAKERQLFNVYDHGDPDKGVQIWDISYWLFGSYLDQKIKDADPDEMEAYQAYFHPYEGYLLKLGASEQPNPNGTHLEFSNIKFKKREALPDEILEGAYCLDEMVKAPDYKELMSVLEGGGDEEDASGEDDDADDSSVDKEENEDVDDSDEDDEEENSEDGGSEDDDDEVAEDNADKDSVISVGDRVNLTWKGREKVGKVIKVNERNKMALVRIPGVDKPQGIELDELSVYVEQVEDDEDEAPPPKKKKAPVKNIGKPGKKPKAPPPDDDDDDFGFDDDDDDTPPPPKSKKGKKRPPVDDDDDEIPF